VYMCWVNSNKWLAKQEKILQNGYVSCEPDKTGAGDEPETERPASPPVSVPTVTKRLTLLR
jgi:hypothetical protein